MTILSASDFYVMLDFVSGEMEDLIKLGFQRIGQWRLAEGKPVFEPQVHTAAANSLYAFISGGCVKYVGKTIKSVMQRMYQYQHPGPTQRTNIRNRRRIMEALISGQTVEVFVLSDLQKLQYANIPINMAAGLEDGLIARFQPEWNIAGKGSKKSPQLQPKSQPVIAKLAGVTAAKCDKYKKLNDYLKTQSDACTLTFDEIESILGCKLPNSARQYTAWWANGGHSQAQAWLRAGWRVSGLQLSTCVTFKQVLSKNIGEDQCSSCVSIPKT